MSTGLSIPDLATARLRLRAFRAADLDAFSAMHADPAVMRHLGAGQVRTRAETWGAMERILGQWSLRGYGMFALEDMAGRFVGRAGVLHPLEWSEPELAYALARQFWGSGLATEAATAIRDWAFAGFAFPRLASFIRPDNAASIRIVARMGAVREATVTLLGGSAELWVHYRPGTGPVA
jgi:RimJ/RimL family protein N-acetyltransferase